MKKNITIAGTALYLLLSFASKPVFAADDCTIVYGGGEITCKATISVTPTAQPSPTTPTGQTTTKGGLPVYSPTDATETPGTGPEAFGLISLIPAAAAGWYLRKKTK